MTARALIRSPLCSRSSLGPMLRSGSRGDIGPPAAFRAEPGRAPASTGCVANPYYAAALREAHLVIRPPVGDDGDASHRCRGSKSVWKKDQVWFPPKRVPCSSRSRGTSGRRVAEAKAARQPAKPPPAITTGAEELSVMSMPDARRRPGSQYGLWSISTGLLAILNFPGHDDHRTEP